MIVFPPAKINIGLQITDKRSDGYHNLVSVFYPIALCDVLELVVDKNAPAGTVKFHPSGRAVDGNPDNNLVLKAIRLFHAEFPLPGLTIYLHKVIPMGAGLGGGSSDATHTLLALNALMNQPVNADTLFQMALQLGSDCPFFLRNSACFVEGRGERLQNIYLNLSGYHLALINPGVHVSTAQAFAMVTPKQPNLNLKDVEELPPELWQGRVVNDFEGPVVQMFPEIRAALHVLNDAGAVYASMSGSGSTVYGIFKTKPQLPQLPKHWMKFEQELIV
jgi:4-diphosphocytidyl-2-C-methyl-D-erythritol kinase